MSYQGELISLGHLRCRDSGDDLTISVDLMPGQEIPFLFELWMVKRLMKLVDERKPAVIYSAASDRELSVPVLNRLVGHMQMPCPTNASGSEYAWVHAMLDRSAVA